MRDDTLDKVIYLHIRSCVFLQRQSSARPDIGKPINRWFGYIKPNYAESNRTTTQIVSWRGLSRGDWFDGGLIFLIYVSFLWNAFRTFTPPTSCQGGKSVILQHYTNITTTTTARPGDKWAAMFFACCGAQRRYYYNHGSCQKLGDFLPSIGVL